MLTSMHAQVLKKAIVFFKRRGRVDMSYCLIIERSSRMFLLPSGSTNTFFPLNAEPLNCFEELSTVKNKREKKRRAALPGRKGTTICICFSFENDERLFD